MKKKAWSIGVAIVVIAGVAALLSSVIIGGLWPQDEWWAAQAEDRLAAEAARAQGVPEALGDAKAPREFVEPLEKVTSALGDLRSALTRVGRIDNLSLRRPLAHRVRTRAKVWSGTLDNAWNHAAGRGSTACATLPRPAQLGLDDGCHSQWVREFCAFIPREDSNLCPQIPIDADQTCICSVISELMATSTSVEDAAKALSATHAPRKRHAAGGVR